MTGDDHVLISVSDFAMDECGVPRWTWQCSPHGHEPAFTHTVALGGSVKGHRFLCDPHGFVRDEHADPPTVGQIVSRQGEWLREKVLGDRLWTVLANSAAYGTGVARLVLRADRPEWEIARYPLGLAADREGSLVDRGLTFVIEPTTAEGNAAPRVSPTRIRDAAARPVHLIGAFHHPGGEDTVDLRAEQRGVLTTVRDIGRDGQADVTTQTLSHRLTHTELRGRLEHTGRPYSPGPAPWQLILHLAAPGPLGGWAADDGKGRQQALAAADLIDMLRWAPDRILRLAVISGRPADPSQADLMAAFAIEAAGCGVDTAGVGFETAALGVGTAALGIAAASPEATAAAPPAPAAPAPADRVPQAAPAPSGDGAAADRLAADLARLHGCAVLAFRHPIDDSAAVRILTSLYRKLLDRELPLPGALALAIADNREAITGLDAISPVLYGAAATDLTVHKRPLTAYRTTSPKLLPSPPGRLFGHHDAMELGDAIIGPGSRREGNGIVLHGMEGVGKSACAAELINQHADHYRRILHHPTQPWPEDPGEALEGFLDALIRRFSEIEDHYRSDRGRVPSAADLVTDPRELTRFCDLLTAYLTRNQSHNNLVYLEGVGPLLNDLVDDTPPEPGRPAPDPWRHPGWHKVIGALTDEEAVGFRLIMTSPRPVPLRNMESIPVRLLSPREAFRYARSLPHLGDFIDRAARDPDERGLVERILHATEGHPALLALADTAAGKGAEALRRLVEDGCTATADDQRIQDRLGAWARDAIDRLAPDDGSRDLLFVLCRLSAVHRVLVHRPDDPRATSLLAVVWAGVRSRPLEPDDVAADIRRLLTGLRDENLIHLAESPDGRRVGVRIHPAVVRAAETAQHTGTADDEGAARLREVARVAADHTEGLVREAFRNRSYGRSADLQFLIPEALPYLESVERWDLCLEFIGGLLSRAPTGHVRDEVKRLLRRINGRAGLEPAQLALSTRLLKTAEKTADTTEPPATAVALAADAPGAPRADLRLAAVTQALYVRGLRECGHLREAREAGEEFLKRLDPGAQDSTQAALLKVELLRVLRDLGVWREVLEGVGPVFDTLVPARWTAGVDHYSRHGDGETLRKDLFALRRDCEFLLAEQAEHAERAEHATEDKLEHDRPGPRRVRARADHLSLERYARREDRAGLAAHRHRVEGVLLGLDDDADRPGLRRLETQLGAGLRAAERHGDEALRAMTKSALARTLRLRARALPEAGDRWCAIRKHALSLEHEALRMLYKSGTPMDVGACHLRIRDDESGCPRPEIRELALFHHLFVLLVGELTHAHALREGAVLSDEQRAGMREFGSAGPDTPEALCAALRGDPTGGKEGGARSLIDPATLLSGLAGPGESGARGLRSAWERVVEAFRSDVEHR
ncbi:hypothetical protein ABZ330_13320 [Streptomyces sp. NPDC006172]|uniref:hypothetical protein n=1 Tax=Streptomyces sp. NPDC006172 TaxID=3154470 RepID=UPI00340B3335